MPDKAIDALDDTVKLLQDQIDVRRNDRAPFARLQSLAYTGDRCSSL